MPTERRRFDTTALYAALDAKRRAEGLTWKQVADEVGVSPTTLTRTAKGGRMELDGVMFMLQWLGMPAEAFLRGPGGVSASPFRKYRGHLKHLRGRDSDDLVGRMRGE